MLELAEYIWVLGGHTNKTEAETDTVHDRLLLARVSVAIDEVVDKLLRALVLVDEAIGKVCTGTGVWGSWLLSGAMEVWIQNLKSILLISAVDDTERSSSVEPIPVCGLGYPLEVVLKEGVVGCIGIHHTI